MIISSVHNLDIISVQYYTEHDTIHNNRGFSVEQVKGDNFWQRFDQSSLGLKVSRLGFSFGSRTIPIEGSLCRPE